MQDCSCFTGNNVLNYNASEINEILSDSNINASKRYASRGIRKFNLSELIPIIPKKDRSFGKVLIFLNEVDKVEAWLFSSPEVSLWEDLNYWWKIPVSSEVLENYYTRGYIDEHFSPILNFGDDFNNDNNNISINLDKLIDSQTVKVSFSALENQDLSAVESSKVGLNNINISRIISGVCHIIQFNDYSIKFDVSIPYEDRLELSSVAYINGGIYGISMILFMDQRVLYNISQV